MKTQLVCTFVYENTIDRVLGDIGEEFNIVADRVFLLSSDDPSGELILSYNVLLDSRKKFLPNSILVHRKKESNTIYTINALNALIVTLNNGVLDKKFPIDWHRYRDMMLLKRMDAVKKLKIETVKVYTLG